MKKLTAMVMALLMLCTLFGCATEGGGQQQEGAEGDAPKVLK